MYVSPVKFRGPVAAQAEPPAPQAIPPGGHAVWANIYWGFGWFLGRFWVHFQKRTSQVFLFSKIRLFASRRSIIGRPIPPASQAKRAPKHSTAPRTRQQRGQHGVDGCLREYCPPRGDKYLASSRAITASPGPPRQSASGGVPCTRAASEERRQRGGGPRSSGSLFPSRRRLKRGVHTGSCRLLACDGRRGHRRGRGVRRAAAAAQ